MDGCTLFFELVTDVTKYAEDHDQLLIRLVKWIDYLSERTFTIFNFLSQYGGPEK